jgi:hypothetical protein
VKNGPLAIGGPGEGVFYLGNLDGTGRVAQASAQAPVDLSVGRRGTLHGWGEVALTGGLTNNGAIVANGYGQPRTLDLTSFSSVTGDATGRGGRGWYAVGGARLDLPAVAVAAGATSTITWGGRNDGSALSLVNSARITYHDVTTPASVAVSLLSLDRADLPAFPAGHHLVGAWSIDQGGLVASGGMDLLVRYDEAVAAAKGLDENVLKLWTYDAAGWHRHDFDDSFVRDPERHTVYAHVDADGVTYFAVSAPEPGTVALLGGAVGLLALRRRRRPE